jgi:hypothetical protein
MISRATSAESADAVGVEFFESKIRPVLADNCYKCHSQTSEKLKGGLLLDTKAGLLKGGDTGPAIVPGDPEKSLLIKAVRYQDEDLQMPPKNKKLPPEQIAALEQWVKMGAPDPRTGGTNIAAGAIADKAKGHWAFKSITFPSAPKVKNTKWPQTSVDNFILAKLEEKDLKPSPKADKRSLVRRATLDLTGLPPTIEEVNEFINDKSPDAFAKVIDRLLASPRYGERWGRHWLDVARYADTKGYVFQEERRYPYSYTYRDYVIRALNEDVPYDKFLIQQLAADLLPLGEDKRPLAALGFLTLGRRFLNSQPDIIDDRIDLVGRGLMGLTVACARCHDHKFDPIPTKDYYSLYGVFASCNEPAEKPLLGASSLPKEYPEYVAEHEKREEEFRKFKQDKDNEMLKQLRDRVGDYLLAAHDSEKLPDKSKADLLAKERKLDPGVVQAWIKNLEARRKQPDPVFTPFFAFESLAETNFNAKSRELANSFSISANGGTNLNPRIAELFSGESPKDFKDVAERYGKLFREIEKSWWELKKEKTNLVEKLPDASRESLRQVLYASGSPVQVEGDLMRLYDVPSAEKIRALRRKIEELEATHPGAPPRAMVLNDNATPTTPHVFIRGSQHNSGAEVPRQFLQVVAGPNRKPFQKGSGRLEMAEAVANRDNPLTARVIVNRIWLEHFGSPLVRTPSDFGLRSDPPTHPELLDYLASELMNQGWSLKKLHRLLMLSSVYQQNSEENSIGEQKDPGNVLFWRMNRRRLDFEATRDSILAISGKIDLSIGGQPIDITTQPYTTRRTVYGFVERQNLPGLFRTFDFASPDSTSPARFSTTVPQQALFMMNSPFVIERARILAADPRIVSATKDEDRIRELYRIAFQRDVQNDELKLGLKYLKSQRALPATDLEKPVWSYGYAEYKPDSKTIGEFTSLPRFTNDAWQGGETLPDAKIGWVMLNAKGGHPGDMQHSAVRRWTAPLDMTIQIGGTIGHDTDKGDGVRAHIISNRAGELGSWTAKKAKHDTKIEKLAVIKGETIDFVVDCHESIDSDSFNWVPTIKLIDSLQNVAATCGTSQWNGREDFSGPKDPIKPLDAIQKYAQIILMSNEVVFMD